MSTIGYTEDDLSALKRAIALGATKVRWADGRETTFRSLSEMKEIVSDIEAELSGKPATLVTIAIFQGY